MDDLSADFQWKGTWREFKGRVKQLWGEITDDDLDVAEGRYQEVLGKIQRRTGEALDTIRRKLS